MSTDTQQRQWMQTYGRRQFFIDPRPEDVHIEVIAHSLSLQCRYTGHTDTHYSVAQHCVLMSCHVPEEDRLWALLHDAAETYLADVAKPWRELLPDYNALEARLLAPIAERFGLQLPIPDSVHEMDRVMLATESRDLMGGQVAPWESIEGVDPLPEKIDPWQHSLAESFFLGRFRALVSERPPVGSDWSEYLR